MGQTDKAGQVSSWLDDGTGRSEAELAFLQGAALIVGALVGILRVVDAVIEAWPLPSSRVRR